MDREELDSRAFTFFGGRYQIERLLGDGGMGKVYLASDSLLDGEKIALKILHRDLCGDEKHTARFLREIQLARKVTHTNIVRTYDVGESDDRLFLTMEYIDGPTLKDLIKEQGRIDPYQLAEYLRSICLGLDAIHEEGIVHRDLKPGNVLIDETDGAKITDFGIARPESSEMTAHNEVVGSIAYMAPELWVGRDFGAGVDLYALGIMAFEALTGSLPFSAKSPAEYMCKHLETPAAPPINFVSDIPLWLNSLVLELLAKKPEARPASAGVVAERIREKLERKIVSEKIDLSQNRSEDLIDFTQPSIIAPPIDISSLPGNQEQPEHVINLGLVKQRAILEKQAAERAGRKKSEYVERKKAVTGAPFILLLGVVGVLTLLLFGPLAVGLEFLVKLRSSQHSLLMTTIGGVSLFLYFSVVFSLPMFCLVLISRFSGAGLRSWLRAIKYAGVFLLVGGALQYLRVFLHGISKGVLFDLGRSVEALQAATEMFFYTVVFIPPATIHGVAERYGNPTLVSSNRYDLEGLISWTVLTFLFAFMFRKYSEGEKVVKKKARYSWIWGAVCSSLLLGERVLVDQVILLSGEKLKFDTISLQIAGLQIETTYLYLLFAALNWMMLLYLLRRSRPIHSSG